MVPILVEKITAPDHWELTLGRQPPIQNQSLNLSKPVAPSVEQRQLNRFWFIVADRDSKSPCQSRETDDANARSDFENFGILRPIGLKNCGSHF